MVGHGAHLAAGTARGDDHEIGNIAFAVEADDDDIFGLVVIE